MFEANLEISVQICELLRRQGEFHRIPNGQNDLEDQGH